MKNNYKTIFATLFVSSLMNLPSKIYAEVTTFQRVYQTVVDESGKDVLPTSDGGYIFVGTIENSVGNDFDIRVVKTNDIGDTVWTKRYVSSSLNHPNCILKTNDGNYFIVGYSQSFQLDQDIYLLKINSVGDVLWSKLYGGFGNEDGKEIIATSDGNYVIVGASNSLDYANNDMQLVKIDPDGNIIWTKYYGGSSYESARSVQLCPDGGFILTGKRINNPSPIASIYLVKTNSSGDTLWTKTLSGGGHSYEGKSIVVNTDGSYTLCVDDSSASTDSDVKIIKINGVGSVMWEKIYGGTEKDICKMIQHTLDGGYIVIATSRSFGWINPDMWLLKLDGNGDVLWSKNYGGLYHDHGYAVKSTTDGGYIAIGHNRDINSTFRVMLVKMDEFGNVNPSVNEKLTSNITIKAYPNPTDGLINVEWGNLYQTEIAFKIYNSVGQEIFSELSDIEGDNNNKYIDLSNNDPGVYFLTIQSEKYFTSKTIIVQ